MDVFIENGCLPNPSEFLAYGFYIAFLFVLVTKLLYALYMMLTEGKSLQTQSHSMDIIIFSSSPPSLLLLPCYILSTADLLQKTSTFSLHLFEIFLRAFILRYFEKYQVYLS